MKNNTTSNDPIKNLNKNLTTVESVKEGLIAKAYKKLSQAYYRNPYNEIKIDARPNNHFYLLAIPDAHIGSSASHFDKIIAACLIIKYVPNVYGCILGDFMNNANISEKCKSNAMDDVINPNAQIQILNELLQDPLFQSKIAVINSGNHENGNRTNDFGLDPIDLLLKNTDMHDKYGRYASVLKVKIKANNKEGFREMVVYLEHGNSLKGTDGKALQTGLHLASKQNADVAIFGHMHRDFIGDYRNRCTPNNESSVSKYHNMTLVELPAPMGADLYALDKRYDVQPNNLKLIEIGLTKQNPYMLGATRKEKNHIEDTNTYADVIPILPEFWEIAKKEHLRLSKKYTNTHIEANYNRTKNYVNKFAKELNKDNGMGIGE